MKNEKKNRLRSLAGLAKGEAGILKRFKDFKGIRGVGQRLMSMGVRLGARVEVTKIAPFGDPIQIRTEGVTVSIRRRDAVGICVMMD